MVGPPYSNQNSNTPLVAQGGKRYSTSFTASYPLLGRKAYLKMNIISHLDNDELHRPATGDAAVYAIEVYSIMTKEKLIKQHPTVFGPGIGRLPVRNRIHVNEQCQPTQQVPR